MNKTLFFILFTASILLVLRYILFYYYAPHLKDNQTISFSTTLLTEPSSASGFNRITIFYSNVFGSQRLLVTYSPKIQLHYGQRIQIIGKARYSIVPGKVQNRLIPGTSRHLILLTLRYPQITIADENQRNIIIATAYFLREKVKRLYYQSLSKQDASLLLGIVFGIKADFSKSFTKDLQSAGVIHVIAASGMNVTMVSGFLFSLASKLFKRQYATIICIGGILFYAVLSGLQASILRASIMGCLVFSAQLFGRQYTAVYGLFLTIFFMLFTQPELIFDIGFQLSMMATMGILFIKPIFSQNKLLDDIETTLSAQIATLPILLMSFGQYGLLSILVNALILWTIPPLMILGGVGAIIGLVVEPLGKLLISLSIPFLWFFEKVVSYFGGLRFNLTIKDVPLQMSFGYYFVLCSLLIFFFKRNKNKTNFRRSNILIL